MATFVATDYSVTINSVDLSDHVRSVTLDYSAETQDDTAMGDSTRSNAGGLKNWTLTVEFLQDYAASEVDATLFSIVGTAVNWHVVPTSGAVSATNPKFNASGLVQDYNPQAGSVGDIAVAQVTIVPGGSAPNLTRSTS